MCGSVACSGQPASEPTSQHLPETPSPSRAAECQRARSSSLAVPLISKQDRLRSLPLQLALNVDALPSHDTTINVITDVTAAAAAAVDDVDEDARDSG